jgi:hypothetical protein
MRPTFVTRIVTVAAALSVVGAALAADLTGQEIKSLLSGKTIYLQLTAASASATPGQGVIYYAGDGTALYKTPSGAIWHGTWVTKENTLCVDWKERPNNACVRYTKNGEVISIVDATTGQTRGTLVKIVDGNAEKLTP